MGCVEIRRKDTESGGMYRKQERTTLLRKIFEIKKPVSYETGIYVRDRIRTHDLLVRSQTLYPAELHAHHALSVR